MAEALCALSAGEVSQPLRTVLSVPEHDGFFGVMPAYGKALGAKLVTFYPRNKNIHLEALGLVREFREVRVWSPRHARAFAEEFSVNVAGSPEEAVRGTDVVVVATAATTPVLHGKWLLPGTHINAVGATRPNWRELDDHVLQRARIFVESREAATAESGDVIASGKPLTEIGELIAKKATGRESADEITLFKSVGVAVEDIAAASLVWTQSDE